MTKVEFLKELRSKLQGLPESDIDDRIGFYHEMIADRVSEGRTEEEAVAEIGNIDDIVKEIASVTPLKTIVKERYKPRRRIRPWEIVLIVLGFPLWFPIVLTLFILGLVGYLMIWILVIVTYSVEIGFIGGAFTAFAGFLSESIAGNPSYLLYLGHAMAFLGASILMVFACIGATKLSIKISKSIFTGIKAGLIRKGRN